MNCRLFSSLLLVGALALHSPHYAFAQDGALPAKPAGVIRIGLVQPRVQTGSPESAKVAESIRNLLGEYLRGPTIEIALLSARLPSQYMQEAALAECDYTLAVNVLHRRGGDGAALGKVLGNFGGYGGYGGYLPGGDALQSMIVSGAIQTAADFATATRAKDVMQLGYQLDAPGDAKPLLKSVVKVRATADGEDLITPLVEKAAEAVGVRIAER